MSRVVFVAPVIPVPERRGRFAVQSKLNGEWCDTSTGYYNNLDLARQVAKKCARLNRGKEYRVVDTYAEEAVEVSK